MFVLVWFTSRGENFSAHASWQQTVKRSDETHEFCKISYSPSHLYDPDRLHQTDEGVAMVVSSKLRVANFLCIDLTHRVHRFTVLSTTFLESKRFRTMRDGAAMLLSLYHLVFMLKDVRAIQKS